MHTDAIHCADGASATSLAGSTPRCAWAKAPSAARFNGRYAMTVCALDGGSVSTTTVGLELTVTATLDALDDADTVIVPGFRRGPAPPRALEALRLAHRRGARIASICTGAFALAQAGLLDGRRATTHWAHADALADEHPRVLVDANALYIDEGEVLTSAGLDLCLYLVGRDHGQDVAIQRARHMITPLHRAGGQAQFIPVGVGGEATSWPRSPLGRAATCIVRSPSRTLPDRV
ncbi:GlxA family transcriptional regulator [Micromonospora sp. NPDC051227]|uniref:GlxA family transcriptional regulator n=1 Tax=Micromonospora sp. NPDC051227 TaxID=3364285 RepID=UPI0037A81BB8